MNIIQDQIWGAIEIRIICATSSKVVRADLTRQALLHSRNPVVIFTF